MRIAQMEAREPYLETLCETLSAGWTTQFGRPISVQREALGQDHQTWKLQPLLSAYVAASPSAQVRQFLGDTFRFTPHRRRAVPQWFAASALTTRAALRWATKPGFTVAPGLPNADQMLVVPGNQRIRVFDFASQRTRVFLKSGFSADTMAREVATRQRKGPFLPVLGSDVDGDRAPTWLEEPLVDAWALPRCPPWVDTAGARREALRQLEQWLLATATVTDPGAWASARLDSIEAMTVALDQRFPDKAVGLTEACRRLCEVAAGLGELLVAQTHGDFQPGNIIVERTTANRWSGWRRVWLIDWEHSRPRSIDYDRFTLMLATRNAPQLDDVWRRFTRGDRPPALRRGLGASGSDDSAEQARARLAMVVLEDIEFYLAESLSGPYTQPSDGLRRHMAALGFWTR